MTPKSKSEAGERWAQKPPRRNPRHKRKNRDQAFENNWIYGHHAVRAALANPVRRCRRLLVAAADGVDAATIEAACEPQIVTPAEIEAVLPAGAVHQGIALLADPLAQPDLAEICAAPAADALVLVLDQVTDPRNLGAVLRAAAGFSADAVIVQHRHGPQITGAAAKAASGAAEIVPVVRATNLARGLGQLAAAGFWRVGLDANAVADLASVGPADGWGRTALVLGAEGRGLRPLVARSCDELARIPLTAKTQVVDSLNVAAAAAIALYEVRRGRA
ncbi:MAG: RNA methyltransferase [Alphaproteobacteria bacterium]|nr:RNA methyltransferase [Alphaproteobacteria bacterium]